MYKQTRIATFILFISVTVHAQAPKYSNEFLSIGVGARALAMSGAQVASVSDGTAGFWNQAGLANTRGDIQVDLMHSEYFAGIAKYDYGSLTAKVDATRTAGLSIIRFAVDNIIDSTDLIDKDGNINYDRLKSFSAADYAFIVSLSKKMKKEGLRVGGNIKVIHRKVGDFAKAWGFGLDVGAQYQKDKWSFGAFGKDITSTFNAWSFNTENLEEVFAQTGNEIPQNGLEITLPKLILGAAYKTNIVKKLTVMTELNCDLTFDGKRNVLIKSKAVSVDPHLGLELAYDDFIYLRGGIGNIQKAKNIDNSTSTIVQPNFGVGIRIKNLTIDYALANVGQDLASNVFSLKLDIFKNRTPVKTVN